MSNQLKKKKLFKLPDTFLTFIPRNGAKGEVVEVNYKIENRKIVYTNTRVITQH